MTEFTSEVKTIPYSDERIFAMLSDLSNLERIKDRIPQEHIKNLSFDSDSCSIEISPIGKVDFQIVNREPFKTIKFGTSNSPVPLFLWIQLKQTDENVTKMKLTIRVELNPLLKTMVSRPVQDGLDKLSEMLATLPYE
jgi:carbon monoxide dehydrogenase subunit G